MSGLCVHPFVMAARFSGLRSLFRETPGLVRLSVPIIAGLAASVLISAIDAVFLAPLGRVPLAAVALTGSVLIVLYAAIYGAISMLGVRIANAHGARAGRQVTGELRNGLLLGLLCGVAAAALMGAVWFFLPLLDQPGEVLEALPPYWASMSAFLVPFAVLSVFKATLEALEALGRAWFAATFAFLGVGLNLPLNDVLIYGKAGFPAMGLAGAGLASLLAESLALVAVLLWWRLSHRARRLRVRQPLRLATVAAQVRSGAPMAGLYALETLSGTVAVMMSGWFGTLALASYQVAEVVAGAVYMVPLGMAGAVALTVARARGAGEGERIRPIVFAGLTVVSAWMLSAALCFVLGGGTIAGWIVDDEETIRLAAAFLVVFAVFQLMDGAQSTMLGALRGFEDVIWPGAVSFISYWVISLPLGYGLAHSLGFGPVAVWAVFVVGLSIAAVALTMRFLWRTGRPQGTVSLLEEKGTGERN